MNEVMKLSSHTKQQKYIPLPFIGDLFEKIGKHLLKNNFDRSTIKDKIKSFI